MLLACALLLPACGGQKEVSPEVTILTYAVLSEVASRRAQNEAVRFNRTHPNVQVEVVEYFDENGRTGKDRLFTEMVTGKIPDIISLGGGNMDEVSLPYQVLARKGYLEDLWPYIENDPKLGRDGVLENVLRTAEIDGGLYTVFGKVSIQTVTGPESIVGDRTGWTLAELMEAFSSMPEDSTILPYYLSKEGVFWNLFSSSIEHYVDRDTGERSFTGEEFKSALEFVNQMTDKNHFLDKSGMEVTAEMAERTLTGRQMLMQFTVGTPMDIQMLDACFGRGGKAVCVGYPTEDGSAGSYFRAYGPLAMSSTCKNKDAAWELLRETLLPRSKDVDHLSLRFTGASTDCISVNRSDYDLMLRGARLNKISGVGIYGFPQPDFHAATEEEIARFEELLNSVQRVNLYDQKIYGIAYEAAGMYFAGDKTLDEAAQLIQNRVTLYLNEQM